MNPIDANEPIKSKEFNKRNNTEDKAEYESDNASDTEKSGAVFSTVVTSHGKFDIDSNNVVIPVMNYIKKKSQTTVFKGMLSR